MTFGVYDADKAIGMLMERSSTGSPRDYAHIQSALLYTSVEGERRVRVCNLSLPVVELAGSVFQYSDQDALVAYMAKDGESCFLSRASSCRPLRCLEQRHSESCMIKCRLFGRKQRRRVQGCFWGIESSVRLLLLPPRYVKTLSR